jgi:RHS repeat-associated protein
MPKTTYVWDELSDNVIEEYEDGVLSVSYTHEPGLYGNLLSQNRNGVNSYYHYDGRGDTVALTDDSGDVTDTKEYDAWGNAIASTGSTATPYMFGGRNGYQTDHLAVYIRARNYQSMAARWASKDPIIPSGLTTTFTYVENSPLLLNDPSGLISHLNRFSSYLAPGTLSRTPFLPPLTKPPIGLPPWVYPDLPLPEPQCDPLCKIELCQDKTTWTKADCPCPCRSTKIGQAPVSDEVYRKEFEIALQQLGVTIGVKVDVKDVCIPGFPGIAVTCPANLTKTGRLYVCLAKGTYNNCDAAALALHEAIHVLQIQNGRNGGEKQAYKQQCEALYEQACCESPCPDARGCYGPPFMNPSRKPNDPIPNKNTLIEGCVRSLLPQSTGATNQEAFRTFCQQN